MWLCCWWGLSRHCSGGGRFWHITEPGAVIFDESHFGKFTAHYMRGSYVFDIHPPLGKMTFAFLGWLMGYDSSVCDYQNIGTGTGSRSTLATGQLARRHLKYPLVLAVTLQCTIRRSVSTTFCEASPQRTAAWYVVSFPARSRTD